LRQGRSSFVLASGSPRRNALLQERRYRFRILVPRIAEISSTALTLRELALCNATRKALAVASTVPDKVVLAADTLVAIDGEIIGKPRDLDEAVSTLRRLSGRVHEVCTAVFICRLAISRRSSFCEISRVRFKNLTNNRIRNYLRKVNPLDKAGAYSAQETGPEIIEQIEGSFTNVVGLPMERTAVELRRFGVVPRRN
jgi:septum formation protein